MTENAVGPVLTAATRQLAAAGVATARLDARVLLAHGLGVAPESLLMHPEQLMDAAQRAAFDAALERRRAGEPVARILGRRGFWTLSLRISPDTLDPRPDTETVVEAVLATLPDRSAALSILDLGTGSGCILLALLAELPGAQGLGTDLSPAAVAIARDNAEATGLASRAAFQVADWGEGVSGPFDVIVANPPYIALAELPGLAPEVRLHDPALALAGGPDGLEAYRALAPHLARLLRAGGVAALEVGCGQAPAVGAILAAAGLTFTGVRPDLQGVPRCVLLGKDEFAKKSAWKLAAT
ncbi:MAG: peptide chain release factor N(5)-glutamine methyltransferase [Alphaproteobacteria bacterium]|nr:peptide chain release factor N(5)-glutamine methyltransferase [Alphaproteobacteria bacterium]